MYLPPHFEETDRAEIEGLIAEFPLAAIVGQVGGDLFANHIPLFLQGESRLIGHVARANDMHRALEPGQTVLAIFRGEESYVSPNWYPSKQTHHRHVPTWNYQVAHVRGAIRFSHDAKDKRAAVGRLTKMMEERANGAAAWRMADAPADYMEKMLEEIVALSIDISGIAAKSKLSQNRERADHDNVVEELIRRGDAGMAQAMRKRPSKN